MRLPYLFFFFVLIFNFWGILPLGGLSPDINLAGTLAYMALAPILFKNRTFSLRDKHFIPFFMIVAGIVLSMIPAKLNFGQSIPQSVITYRSLSLWLSIPFLFWISPSKEEIRKITFWLTVCMAGVLFLMSFFPSLFFVPEKYAQPVIEEDNFVPGFAVAVIPLFFALDNLRQKMSVKDLAIALFCLTFLFFLQNRSSLFPAALIFAVTILLNKGKNRWLVISLGIILGIILVAATAAVWNNLIEETISNLGNDDYNRIKAYLYFFSPQAYPSPMSFILGNGFLSAHSSSEFSDLMDQGIYYSDVGYIGFFNQFGILPIAAFIIMLAMPFKQTSRLAVARKITNGQEGPLKLVRIRDLRRQGYSYFMKIFSIFMIITSLTIGYYGQASSMIVFAIYYYLAFKEQEQLTISSKTEDAIFLKEN